jgi:hypothetical protein
MVKINQSRLTQSPQKPQKTAEKLRPATKNVSSNGPAEIGVYHWRAELKRRTPVTKFSSAPAAQRARPAKSTAATSFVPVRLTTSTSQVEFALASGLVIRVPAQELEALRAVLEIVEPRPC